MSSALARQPRNQGKHAIHASKPLTQAYQPRKHATHTPHVSTSPMQARQLRQTH